MAGLLRQQPHSDLTINEVLLAFLRHAETYYVKDGKATSEQREYRIAIATVRAVYGNELAQDFGPLALKAVRQKMICDVVSSRSQS